MQDEKTGNDALDSASKEPITREILYEQVWSQPMTELAIRYSVSSSYLARICTRLNVPRPERGYWAKLAVGKKVSRPGLPEARPEDELSWSRGTEEVIPNKPSPLPIQKTKRKLARNIKQSTTHHLLKNTKNLFLIGRETDYGYLKPNKKLLVDLIVSKPGLDGAFEIANALFLALERHQHRVKIANNNERFHRYELDERNTPNNDSRYINHWSPMRITVAYINTVAIGFTIYEISEKVEVIYHNGEYIPVRDLNTSARMKHDLSWTTHNDLPSGKFCIQAYSPYPNTTWMKQWRISSKKDLKRQVNKIIKQLEQDVTEVYDLVIEEERLAEIRQKEWELSKLKWEKEEQERKRLKAINESTEELMNIISEWDEVQRIQSFFSQIEEQLDKLSLNEQAKIKERLEKARSLVGGHTPLQHLRSWLSPDERITSEI